MAFAILLDLFRDWETIANKRDTVVLNPPVGVAVLSASIVSKAPKANPRTPRQRTIWFPRLFDGGFGTGSWLVCG